MTTALRHNIPSRDDLNRRLAALRFGPPVTHVYNPLDYAGALHRQYLERFGQGGKEVVLLGMNPGPWGMAQTGVPFGEVAAVRDWLRLDAPVDRPRREHPKRPVQGLACPRNEVSGQRLWGWARDTWRTPQRFFRRFVVANYCPLCFLEESGRNRTPDKLAAAERDALFAVCDDALREAVTQWQPRWVVGIGQFAEGRARAALADFDVQIGRMLHPSPASPLANRGWAPQATAQLQALGIAVP